MARINMRPSYASTAQSSRYNSATPIPGNTSDQENEDPSEVRMDKGKQRARDAPSRASLPTPGSDSSNEARGQKRKRAEQRATQREEEEEEDDMDSDAREEDRFNRYFDPNQDPEERREIKRKSRALERDFQENREDLLRGTGRGLTNTIQKANDVFKNVKQTNDATLDSRLLVNVSDLAYKKTAQLVLGDTSTGVDVDEFLSKCITYMRNGGPLAQDDNDEVDGAPSSTRRRTRPRHRNEDSDNEEEDDARGEPLDWEVLGRHACYPYNSRPCVPSFLLGPLSAQKKQRTQTQRRARQSKDVAGREAQPEALSREQLTTSDESGLTAICLRINKHLQKHVSQAEKAVERAVEQAGFTSQEDLKTDQGRSILKKCRITDTGGVGLFDFVLNPQSFGQTVENLFYVSFLIKEGSFGVGSDSQGLPTLEASTPSSLDDQRKNNTSKHQAVFSLDYGTWQQLIEAFDVTEPLIEHRIENDEEQATRMGARGWYT